MDVAEVAESPPHDVEALEPLHQLLLSPHDEHALLKDPGVQSGLPPLFKVLAQKLALRREKVLDDDGLWLVRELLGLQRLGQVVEGGVAPLHDHKLLDRLLAVIVAVAKD